MQQQDYKVALNFFPLAEQDFHFTVYRVAYHQQETRPDGCEHCTKHMLPASSSEAGSESKYDDFWVSFTPMPGFEAYVCNPRTNDYLTVAFIFHHLRKKSKRVLNPSAFAIQEEFTRRIAFFINDHKEGHETVWLEPFFLKTKKIFGILADFEFRKADDIVFGRKIQQLSLSLDKHYKENRNFYVDRFGKLQNFIKDFYDRLFPIEYEDGHLLTIKKTLALLDAPRLSTKNYVFGGEKVGISQFRGVSDHGPLRSVEDDVLLYFVYRPADKPLSYDLYRALRGDTYPTFSGMKGMFGYELGERHVSGLSVDDFSQNSIDYAIQLIQSSAPNRLVVPICIVPWSKLDEKESAGDNYYTLKYTFLKHNLPTQLVSVSTLQDKNKLKWSISNIALGVFAKMGGHPWKVKPQTDKCLIIGIGQSHKIVDGTIDKYYAYSVLTDSSGLYEDLRTLGRSTKENAYLDQLKFNLTDILRCYASRFDKFAIHTTFAIRQNELDAIREVIDSYSSESNQSSTFIVLKFNDRNKFFGYSSTSNSMIPYESTYVALSFREYLVWFEGLQYHNPNVYKRIGGPVYIKFLYPDRGLDNHKQIEYLQDSLNLSGANWRGFNAKSLPISIYYAQIVARYLKEFDRLGLEQIDLSKLTPWFL